MRVLVRVHACVIDLFGSQTSNRLGHPGKLLISVFVSIICFLSALLNGRFLGRSRVSYTRSWPATGSASCKPPRVRNVAVACLCVQEVYVQVCAYRYGCMSVRQY